MKNNWYRVLLKLLSKRNVYSSHHCKVDVKIAKYENSCINFPNVFGFYHRPIVKQTERKEAEASSWICYEIVWDSGG